MLLKKNSHALAIRRTGDKTDIILEAKKSNIISSEGAKDLFFLRKQLLGLFKSLKKFQLSSFVKCSTTEILDWNNVNIVITSCTFAIEKPENHSCGVSDFQRHCQMVVVSEETTLGPEYGRL